MPCNYSNQKERLLDFFKTIQPLLLNYYLITAVMELVNDPPVGCFVESPCYAGE
jgi:hypothetical protein